MKSFDTEFKKYAEKINLKVAERRELRERVLSYMEYHPLKKQTLKTADLVGGIPSESFVMFHVRSLHLRIVGGVFALVLIVAPFLAEQAKPGDVLYFVKTGFNESIQGQFATSPYEKIEFETKLMERRIAEARALASEGKLTDDVKAQIAETVKGHTAAVQSNLVELRSQDADGAAIAQIAFNSSLEVQSAVLDAEESTENDSLIETIRTVVNEAREDVVTNQESEKPSYEGLTARVELQTTRAYELFEAIKKTATEEEIKDIERRLNDVNRLVGEAKEKHTTDVEMSAHNLATTLGLLQKLIVFMADIDVRESVSLESIVPVVLSDAERTDIVKEEIRVLRALHTEVESRLGNIEGEAINEKVTRGLATVDELLLTGGTAIDVSDIGTAEALMKEARMYMTDLERMTERGVEPQEEVVPEENVSEEGEVESVEEATTTEDGTEEEAVGTTTPEVVSEF